MNDNRTHVNDRVELEALDWTALGEMVRQRASAALSGLEGQREHDSPVRLSFVLGKDSA